MNSEDFPHGLSPVLHRLMRHFFLIIFIRRTFIRSPSAEESVVSRCQPISPRYIQVATLHTKLHCEGEARFFSYSRSELYTMSMLYGYNFSESENLSPILDGGSLSDFATGIPEAVDWRLGCMG